MKANRLGNPHSPAIVPRNPNPKPDEKEQNRTAIANWFIATDRLAQHLTGSLVDEIVGLQQYLSDVLTDAGLVVEKRDGAWIVTKTLRPSE
jgi:hypothetical protein